MTLYVHLIKLAINYLYFLIIIINFHIFIQIDKTHFYFFINQLIKYLFFILIINLNFLININLITFFTFKH